MAVFKCFLAGLGVTAGLGSGTLSYVVAPVIVTLVAGTGACLTFNVGLGELLTVLLVPIRLTLLLGLSWWFLCCCLLLGINP